MGNVPPSFKSAAEGQSFLSSLSDVDRCLLDQVVAASHNADVRASLGMSGYWPAANSVQEVLPHGRANKQYSQMVLQLFEASSWAPSAWSFVQFVAMGVAAQVSDEMWFSLLSPLRVAMTVPIEWRPTVTEAVDNLGIVAALNLPTLVPAPVSA